jgi:hypothetical protein
MLTDQEKEVLITIIRDGKIETFSILLIRKVFEDYNVTEFKGQNYYQFGVSMISKIIMDVGIQLMEKDNEELKKTIQGLYLDFAMFVQPPHLNE